MSLTCKISERATGTGTCKFSQITDTKEEIDDKH